MLENIPQKVYDLALAKDLSALRQLQSSGVCLGQYHFQFNLKENGFIKSSAATKLAFYGEHEAANFLVDHLMASIDDLVRGYSHRGDIERTRYWVNRGGHRGIATSNAAYHGQEAFINELMAMQDANVTNAHCLIYIIYGYARALNHRKVIEYLSRKPTEHPDHPTLLYHAMLGYAEANDPEHAMVFAAALNSVSDFYQELPYRGTVSDVPPQFQRHRLLPAANYGDDETIKAYMADNTLSLDEFIRIANAYLTGGHLNEALALEDTHLGILAPDEATYQIMIDRNMIGLLGKILTDTHPKLRPANGFRAHRPPTPILDPYVIVAKNLSKHPDIIMRQLLLIDDIEKRRHLHSLWFGQGTGDKFQWAYFKKIQAIERIMLKTDLGFDCSHTLAIVNNLTNTVNLITVSLHQAALIFNERTVLNKILTYLLKTDELTATKIQGHFFRLFIQHVPAHPVNKASAQLAPNKQG